MRNLWKIFPACFSGKKQGLRIIMLQSRSKRQKLGARIASSKIMPDVLFRIILFGYSYNIL